MKLWPAYLGIALCISVVIFASAFVIGRAVDAEVKQRVVFTKNGVTLDCERITTSDLVTYGSCITVP